MNSEDLKIKKDMLIIAADGDGVGKRVGRAVLANDVESLHKISERIDAAQAFILHWAQRNDGIKISGGGDEFTAAIPKEALDNIEALRKDIEHAFGYTISVGVGKDLAEAGTALLVAKLRGKDRIVKYSKEIENDIKKAKRRVRENRATPDEYKLAEAYLTKSEPLTEDSCPYCQQTDGVDPTHCKWCHDLESDKEDESCPYCKDNEQSVPQVEMGNENDCAYCQENESPDNKPFNLDNPQSMPSPGQPEMMAQDNHFSQQMEEQVPRIQSPDSNNSNPPAGSAKEKADYDQMGMNPPIIGKPTIGNNSSPAGIGDSNQAYDTAQTPVEPPSATGDEVESGQGIIPDEPEYSKEILQAIAQQMANEDVDGKPTDQNVAQNVDDTDIVGDESEENVSRPADFGSNNDTDMGLDEEHAQEENPDLTTVLKEGLENQSDNIDKEKVRDMVGQALDKFKDSKEIIEKAKEQAPDFYQANIAMLAAMIKMAEMLSLRSKETEEQEDSSQEHTDIPKQEENEWSDPFPKHPAHEEQEGFVGQPIGKLPKKATKHVARTTLPPGAINAKGQEKVIDPKTGKTRFIDRKQGMVQSNTGVPIKPPSRN